MVSIRDRIARHKSKKVQRVRPRRVEMELLEDRRVLAANLQVVHNSPYDAASVVDVYINDSIAIDNFEFRDATGFLELASDTPLKLDIKGADSTEASPSVFSANVTLADGRDYVALAVGDPTGSEGQPAFEMALTDMGQTAAQDAANVEFAVFHGSPDAPTVDVVGRSVGVFGGRSLISEFLRRLPFRSPSILHHRHHAG